MLFTALFFRVAASLALLHLGWTYEKMDYIRKKVRRPGYPLQIHNMYRDKIPKITTVGMSWSAWSPWTLCSRSCGGGVTQQTRHCVSRPADSRFSRRQRRRRQTSGCVGLYKRIRLCNTQECPKNSRDFRYDQCASYNNRPFKGKHHHWEPFLLATDECTLNCRPLGMNFYATLNKTVIDGTECKHPMTSAGRPAPKGTKGVCIDGYCKSVNANGIIGSIDENNSQEECSLCLKGTCRSINGLYTRPDLPSGYSLVAQLPIGACKIFVQQLKHTRNFLALRYSNGSFIINGDWKLSKGRVFDGAGTKFNYHPGQDTVMETITAAGPLAHPIDLMIVNYQSNTGIKYSYAIPVDETRPVVAPPLLKRPQDPEPRWLDTPNQKDEALRPHRRNRIRRRFTWKITGVSACSKSCGSGVQATVLTCVKEHNQTPVPDRRCSHLEKPTIPPIRCNIRDCPPEWGTMWSSCSATCGEGLQRLVYQCQQELSTGRTIVVNEDGCVKPKPAMENKPCRLEPCESDNELPQGTSLKGTEEWTVGAWSSCSVTCGTGHRSRSVTCPSGRCHPENRPKHAEYCENGLCTQGDSWMVTEWSHCSAICGTGNQQRLVICPQNNCSDTSKPEMARSCSSDKQCGGQWFTGPWSPCSDSCTGLAKQTREVFCIVKIRGQSHITNDMTCSTGLKPELEQLCDGTCPPYHWFIGEWGGCDSCPNGVQRREVKCMDRYGRLFEGCTDTDMPMSKRQCTCRREEQKYQPAQDEPADRSCVDRIRNCYLAVQARLCQYPYYTNHCCVSCKRAQQDLLE